MNPFNNLPIKIICLILAIGFWIFTSFQLGRIGTFPADLDIDAINVGTELQPVLSDKTVKVRISAQPQVWQKLSSESFQAKVDLQGKKEGIHQMPVVVTADNPDILILKILPEKIQVSLEKITDNQAQVAIQIDGTPKKDFVVTGYQINPGAVTVKTANSIYQKISKVVAKVKVEGEENDFSRIYQLQALDNQGNSIPQVSFEPNEVNVNVAIGKAGNVKAVGIKPLIIDNPKQGFLVESVTVNPAVLTIRGTASKVYDVEYISTNPLSIKDQEQDLQTESLLVFPKGITAIEDIKQVTVTIKISEIQIEKELSVDSFSYINLATGLGVSRVTPTSLQLKIKGPINIINQLQAGDVKIKLDLANFQSSGIFATQIQANNIELPAGTELVDFSSQSFNIQLSAN